MNIKLIIPLLFMLAGNIHAQDTVWKITDIGRLDSLYSNVLKEERFVEVFIPEKYKPGSTDKYDVLYVLDGGNWNTGLINKVQRFLEGESYTPPTIVVSVMGIDRNKDLTPTHTDSWKNSGNGANFLSFIKNELIPYINQKYPANNDNAIWGHSLGGMFVINAMLTEPATFKTYIAVDPSLWWDNEYIQKIAPDKLPALAGLNTTLYISGREGREGAGMKIASFDTILKSMAPPDLNWKIVQYPGETHSSIRLKTTYDGLRFAYGWNDRRMEFHPMNGMIAPGKPIKLWYFTDSAKVRYTLDGSEPVRSSATVIPEITITEASKFTAKQFTNRARYDKVKTGNFTAEPPLKPVAKLKNAKPGGFHYAYYEDTIAKKPALTGITNADFDIDKLPRKNNYTLVIDGQLEIKDPGYYIFVMDADKNSKFYLNNKQLIKWEGSYTDRTYSYILPLEKGFYSFKLDYIHKIEDFKLEFRYLNPDGIENKKDPVTIPLNLQYSQQ